MTQFSLSSLEQYRQLTQRAPASGDASAFLSSLRPGQVLQAQVVQSLGDSLFTLKFADLSFTTASSTPLVEGERLTLQVSSNTNGRPNLSVLTVADGALAAAGERPQAPANPQQPVPGQATGNQTSGQPQALAQIVGRVATSGLGQTGAAEGAVSTGAATGTGKPIAQFGPAVIREFQSLFETNDVGSTESSAISPKLASLLQPDGPVARLLERRPDLAPRLENLLTEFQQRPDGLGKGISQLTDQLNRLIQSVPGDQRAALTNTQNRLVAQILGDGNLNQPEQLAEQLSNRLQQWVRGFEGTIARFLPETAAAGELLDPRLAADQARVLANVGEPDGAEFLTQNSRLGITNAERSASGQGASAASNPTPLPAATGDTNLSTLRGDSPPREAPAASSTAGQVVRGTFESDLKGQLLELRSQLVSIADRQSAQSASSQQAIARVDALLNQVTAQQVRNVEGLNQFLYAELPVDPRTGIGEARLQVFYRNQGSPAKPNNNDRFTVALFLNLTKLGDVLAVVSEVDKAVTVGFTVENPAARNLLSSQTDLLRTALVKSGHAGATVTVRAPAKPEGIPTAAVHKDDEIWQSFLDAGPVSGDPGGRLDLEA